MKTITLAHGSGGMLTDELINNIFYKHFSNQILLQGNDYALLPMIEGKIVVSTDSFVVNPLFFPGGDIGKLAICGTVNDLVMSGARPLYLTVGFVLEEGLKLDELEKIVRSMALTAGKAGIRIVAGDTKVVKKGQADKIYINTTGLGVVNGENCPAGDRARPGDNIIINGSIGEHGLAVLLARENFGFAQQIESDCALLNGLIESVIKKCKGLKVLRDPTRGGLATTLNEIAFQSGVSLQLDENKIMIREEVRAVCALLGFDPLYLANEGKVVFIVAAEESDRVLSLLKNHELGQNAAVIGKVISDGEHRVEVKTAIGGCRLIKPLQGDQLPRIC